MEYEEKENRRMDNELYPYFKFIAQNKNNPEKLNQLLRHVNGGAEQCIQLTYGECGFYLQCHY